MKEIVTDIEKLRDTAIDQHGFVTTSQAEEVGVSRPSLTYLLKNGRLERPRRGIYRVPQILATQFDAMHLALLWASEKTAVLSHDTALDAWDVCDVNPTKIYITVPKQRRINKADGDNIVIYHQDLPKDQITWWEQMPIVKLPLTIDQCITRKMSSHLIMQAIENGRKRGMLTEPEAASLIRAMEVRDGT